MLVEWEEPNGDFGRPYRVTLTTSGLLIQIDPGSVPPFLISRFAWPGIVAAMESEMAQREGKAKEWVKTNYREGD